MRYTVVGGIAFFIDLGCLLALVDHMPLLAANTVAFLVANAFNFWLGHVWVFGQEMNGPEVPRQYAGVLAISVVGLALNDAIVWGGVEIAGVSIFASKIIASGVVMFWNYLARVLWVYRKA